MRTVKSFSDGTKLAWDYGRLDAWCVYTIDNNNAKTSPKDVDYFTDLLTIAQKYGNQRVYKDFVTIYDNIKCEDPEKCNLPIVAQVASTYPEEDRKFVEYTLTIFWMAMVSEWNYKIRGIYPSRLKHRIKRLGVYTMLIDGKDPEYATTFMKNMPWQEVNELCKVDNFNL